MPKVTGQIVKLNILFIIVVIFLSGHFLYAQKQFEIKDSVKQHIFGYNEIQVFEDKAGKYSINEVADPLFNQFKDEKDFIPKIYNYKCNYWYRIKVLNNSNIQKDWLLEFYDQSIENIKVYVPDEMLKYKEYAYGSLKPFEYRLYHHKNFTVKLNPKEAGQEVIYFSISSQRPANIMVVLKPLNWFIQYGLKEYFLSGIFYGMILVFCLYNLVMFFAVRKKQYLYYITYNLSIGLFEMSANGFAYQYLWPNYPVWNQLSTGVSLYIASVCSLLFTNEFLHLKSNAPLLKKFVMWIVAIRTIFFLLCIFVNQQWFAFKFIEIVPLVIAFYAGIRILRKGYKPAKFFVAGYFFLFLGFLIRFLKTLASYNLPFGPINFYSLNFCFLMEMIFLSFAIGQKISWLKKKRDIIQKQMIEELKNNQELKDNLNKDLEKKVLERTREVIEKSEMIELQNEELVNINELLKFQAEEIFRMNEILSSDNKELEGSIKKVIQARVMSAEMNFSEFSKIYPDDEACYEFLAKLKWDKGYTCKKCQNGTFFNGVLPSSRRCSKCSYDESATNFTIFKSAHIPLNKAFYMAYKVYATNGKISSYKLSEELLIRQSTCWSYASKVKKILTERKKELKNAGERGWSKLVLENI